MSALPKRDASSGGYAAESVFEIKADDSVRTRSHIRWLPSYSEYPTEFVARAATLAGPLAITSNTAHLTPIELLAALADYRPIFAVLAPSMMAEPVSFARKITPSARVRLSVKFFYQSLYGAVKIAGRQMALGMDIPGGLNAAGELMSEVLEVTCHPQHPIGLAFHSEALVEDFELHHLAWRSLLEARSQELREILTFRPPTEVLEPGEAWWAT